MASIGNRKFAVAFHRFRFNMIRPVADRLQLSTLSAPCLITSLLVVTVFGVHLLTDFRTCFPAPLYNRKEANVSTVVSVSSQFGYDDNRSSTSSNSTDSSPILTPRLLVNVDHLCDARDRDDANVTSLPLYLVIVHSRPDEVGQAQRDAIRATWGSNARKLLDGPLQKPDIRIVFVVGLPSLAVPQVRREKPVKTMHDADFAKLRHESELYGDLVVADFVDAYRRLTVKSLIGMHWARTWCSSAQYIVKVDDDVFLFVDLLPEVVQRWRRSKVAADRGIDDDKNDLMIGSLNVDAKVQRRGVWRVDRRTFAADRFPPYCSGNVYVMTSSAVDLLLMTAKADEQISAANLFPLEDVYVTSMLAAKSGLRCRHDDAFPHWHVGPTGSNVKRMCARKLIAVHNVDYQRMYGVNDDMMTRGCYRKEK